MTAGPDRDQQLRELLAKVAAKSWFWLFRKADLTRGMTPEARPRWEAARWTGESRLVIEAEVGSRRRGGESKLTVELRKGESGGLSVITDCESCRRPHCAHAAAVLVECGEPGARQWLEEKLQLSARVEPAEVEVPAPSVQAVLRKVPTRRSLSEPAPVVIRHAAVTPVLKLYRVPLRETVLNREKLQMDAIQRRIGVAELRVRYEGCEEALTPITSSLRRLHEFRGEDGLPYQLERDVSEEKALATDLILRSLHPFPNVFPEASGPSEGRVCFTVGREEQTLFWAGFLKRDVEELREQGWKIEVEEGFGFEVLQPASECWFTDLSEMDEGENRGWFRMDLGFEVGGQRISLVPVLSRALEEGLTVEVLEEAGDQNFMLAVEAPGDPVVSLPAARLLPLMRFLAELMSFRPVANKSGGVRMDRLQAAQLTELDGMSIEMPESLRELRERLEDFESIREVTLPEGLRAELRPYQREGVKWLQFLREFGLHGVLADDMGLGKTLQTIVHLLIEKTEGRARRPSLILAPTSVMRNWQREMRKFAPEMKLAVLHGSGRQSLLRRAAEYDVLITSYPLLLRDLAQLEGIDWHAAVLDEAQAIKNPSSQSSRAVRRLSAQHRICLSGTPMENHLGELWSIFEFLMPGFLGEARAFRSGFRNPIEKEGDADRQRILSQRIRPLLLRRTKDAVAKDLPPKTEIVHSIELEGEQVDLYETIRAVMDRRVREAIESQGLDRSQIVVLDALLKLRQVCCHPGLLKQESAQGISASAKMTLLMEQLLPELVEEGRQVLVFSQFTEMLGLIEVRLKEAGIGYVKLTGSTKDRETPVDQFQAGEVPVFLISLKAGGSGLNLTAADTVIHYDPWWNPAAEAQASDRAHRIGQTQPVFVHKLICAHTIEEKILELQRKKAAMLKQLLGAGGGPGPLSPEEIQHLLDPIG